jgi:hypothetical protein
MAVAVLAVGIELTSGAAVASTDHLVTHWSQRMFAANPPDWLDRSRFGRARYLVLPNANPFLGTSLESWNRNVSGLVVLEAPAPDPYARSVARVRNDGTLEIDGGSPHAQLLVANTTGSQIGWDARVVARPREGLVAYRLAPHAHVHWLARGLAADRWIGTHLRYRVWRKGSPRGRFVVYLAVPRGFAARTVELAVDGGMSRTLVVRPGARVHASLPAPGLRPPTFRIYVRTTPGPIGGRTIGVRVLALRYSAR